MTAKTHPFWMKPPRLSTGEEATPYPLSTNLLTTNVAGTGTMLFFRFQFALRPGHASGKVRGVFNTKWPCLAGTKMGPDLLSTAVGSDSYSAAPPPLSFFFQPKNQPLLTPHFRQESSRKTQPERTPTDLSTKKTRVFFRLPKYQKTREISKNRSGKRQQATNKSFQLEVGVGCYLVGYLVWLCIPGEQRFADLGPLGVKDFFGLPKGTFIGSWKRNKKKGGEKDFFFFGGLSF